MMNRSLYSVSGFILAFLFGSAIGATFKSGELEVVPSAECKCATEIPQTSTTPVIRPSANSEVEFSNLKPYDLEFPVSNDLIELFETQGIYRESEVIAKDGEEWLTLFERGGKYSLELATANVKKKRTQTFPGNEYDVQLYFKRPGEAIFASRLKLGLRPGPVTTLYHRPSQEEIARRGLPIDSMESGYKRDFNLDESWYTLRVTSGRDTDGNKLGVLVLEDGHTSQVIATNSEEIIGNLFWVGDLDGDKKLDLLFDDFNEKGAFVLGLYLSSAAEPRKLVKKVAAFSTAGC
jgi:hypothetical protein